MRKMKLQAEALAVESFEISPGEAGAAGTIHARQGDAAGVEEPKTPGRLGTCFPGICTCDGLPTCDYTGCIPCPAPVSSGCMSPPLIEGQNVPVV